MNKLSVHCVYMDRNAVFLTKQNCCNVFVLLIRYLDLLDLLSHDVCESIQQNCQMHVKQG